jgi:hypothetical protein
MSKNTVWIMPRFDPSCGNLPAMAPRSVASKPSRARCTGTPHRNAFCPSNETTISRLHVLITREGQQCTPLFSRGSARAGILIGLETRNRYLPRGGEGSKSTLLLRSAVAKARSAHIRHDNRDRSVGITDSPRAIFVSGFEVAVLVQMSRRKTPGEECVLLYFPNISAAVRRCLTVWKDAPSKSPRPIMQVRCSKGPRIHHRRGRWRHRWNNKLGSGKAQRRDLCRTPARRRASEEGKHGRRCRAS